ncbi:MAG: tetratricopeptide repeat protein [Gelidibacter sp.]
MNRLFLLLFLLITFKTQAQSSALKLADSLFAYGNYTKAIKAYKAYNSPKDVYDKIAKAYMAIGNYDEAIQNYEAALNANPTDLLVKYEYAKLLSRNKKFNDANVLFNELISADNQNPNYYYELGLVLEQQNDTTAINSYKHAYDLDDTHQKAIYKIAKYYLVKRQHDVSLQFVDKGLQSYANNVELISLKALNYYWEQDYRTAAIWFEKLITLGESSQFIHEKLGFCYAQHYEYEKAIEQGIITLKFDPKNATNLYILGQLYQHIQDYPNAEKYILAALEIQNQPLDAEYINLGTTYNRQKKYKEAIEALQIAVKENPSNETAQFFLVNSKAAYYENIDSKIKVYETFKQKFPESPYIFFADQRLKELNDEKFLKHD